LAEQLKTPIVRIRDSNGAVVGAGFLVTERHVFTCAHVVASALDIADTTPNTPQAEVHLDFPLLAPGHILAARVVFWQPPGTDGGGDIAGLELDGNFPFGAAPARLASAGDRWGHRHRFRALGFPDGHPDGVYASGVLRGRRTTGWIQVEDVKETGYRVEPGFSGTPEALAAIAAWRRGEQDASE